MNPFTSSGVLTYAVAASAYDWRQRRIPNWLSATGLLAALAFAPAEPDVGLSGAVLGGLFGFGFFLLPFARGAIGGGDVKFATVCGTWLGPRLGLHALTIGTVLGLMFALALAARAGQFRAVLQRSGRMLWLVSASQSTSALPVVTDHGQHVLIPYAVPLGMGVIATVVLSQHGWLLL